MFEIDVGAPCATHSDYGRMRRGTPVQPSDIRRMVTPGDGSDVVVWRLADPSDDHASPMRMPLFRVRRAAVDNAVVSMVTRTLTKRTSGFSGTRPGINASDPGSGSITLGSYERRDMPTTLMLRKAGVRVRGSVVCRQTAFTRNMPRHWAKVQPVISRVSELHREMDPTRHAKQLAFVKEHVNPAYHIDDTAYTTVTVNHNHVTYIHVDKGDFKGGSGAMLIAGEGFCGCQLCFPRYGVGVELAPGDVVICDVHEWHGNLPLLEELPTGGQRVSIVAYVREKLAACTKLFEGGDGRPPFGVPEGDIMGPDEPIESGRRIRVRHVKIKKAPLRIHQSERRLSVVADYAHKFGRVPPVGTSHLGVEVGVWCFHRREEKRSGKLSAERALAIERVVPGWSWEPDRRDTSHAHAAKKNAAAESFAATLAVLERFVAANGRLPRSKERSEEEHGDALGKWVVNRRQDIKKGKATADSEDTRDWSRLAEILGMSLENTV